jgi:crotonobetainyl-CoA:carnitine CoA-transferase CaiB-like acyl-CoA transferase
MDYGTGLAAAFGTMIALRHRDQTGEGQKVDLSLFQTAYG